MNYDLLYTMLNTESVSGGEIPLQKKVAAYMREAGFNVDTDKTGNVIAHINEESPVRVLMSGHIDEIGFRVTYISENGMIHVNKAVYIRPELMQGKRVTVLGKKRITGVMGILLKDGNVRTDVALKDMYIDCGFTTDKQAAEWIKPGDFVTYTYAYDMLENNCIAGRGLDDKLGAFTVMQALMREGAGRKGRRICRHNSGRRNHNARRILCRGTHQANACHSRGCYTFVGLPRIRCGALW